MKTEQIMKATNGGRDIFANLFPDLKSVIVSGKRHAFRSPLREDKHASASFCVSDGVFLLHDFASGQNMNAVAAYAAVHNCDYNESLSLLAQEYHITDEPRAERRFQNATYSEHPVEECTEEGTFITEHEFTQGELRLLSPLATAEVCKKYGFSSLKSFYIVRNGKEMTFSSRSDYPIFARKAKMIDIQGKVTKQVTKLYQPRFRPSKDGGSNYKFSYVETGLNPDSIVNGLYEISIAWEHEEDEAKKDKQYRRKPIIGCICCGERDAVCVASVGFYPIWFNSESHKITSQEMKLMRKYTDSLYYIPDIDQPGKEAMLRNMKAFPELMIVELPADLSSTRGDQGKPRKDLRDWFELHPSRDEFNKLLNTAHAYKIVKKRGRSKLSLSADNMRFMLRMNGYYKYFKKDFGEFIYVHIEGNLVEEVSLEQIRNFVVEQVQGYTPEERDVVLEGKALATNIKDLEVIELDFISATADSQLFFARNATFLVNKEGVFTVENPQSCYVWKSKVFNHDVTLLPPLFTYNITEGYENNISFTITDEGKQCKLIEFLRCISLINWMKIDRGEELTNEEQLDNDRNFVSTINNFAYLLHRHREPSRCFAPLYFEHDRIPGIEANGGTGKSIIFEYCLPYFGYDCVKIDAKDDRVLEDKFRYQEVTHKTDIVFYDECHKGFKMSRLNSDISSGIQVEQKFKTKRTIKGSYAPKIACLSNYDPTEFDTSVTRRTSYNPMSNFFHAKDQYGHYADNRQVDQYFNMPLWDNNYPQVESNIDYNAAMQICSFGLAIKDAFKDRPEAPMKRVKERVAGENTQGIFGLWATKYFIDNKNVDKYITKDEMIADYNAMRSGLKLKAVKSNTFTKDLKQWLLANQEYEYNPDDLCTDHQTRRIKRSGVEYIYVRHQQEFSCPKPGVKEGSLLLSPVDPDDDRPF